MTSLIVVPCYGKDYIAGLATAFRDIPTPVVFINTEAGGRDTGAYLTAYRKHRNFDGYFFMHDSMQIKRPDFLKYFARPDRVTAWLRFPFFFDEKEQEEYIAKILGQGSYPPDGIFGSIFYVPRQALATLEKKKLLPVPPLTRLEQQGWERGWAIAFHRAGIPVEFIDRYDSVKFNSNQYEHFYKIFVGR